jgi:hypothetical protein
MQWNWDEVDAASDMPGAHFLEEASTVYGQRAEA